MAKSKTSKPVTAQPDATLWFQITLNKDGSVSSCSDSLPGIDDKGRRIYYIQANSKEDAIRILAAKYDRQKVREISRRAALKRERAAKGLCLKCGDPLLTRAFLNCDGCRSGQRRVSAGDRSKVLRPHHARPAPTTPEAKAVTVITRQKIARDRERAVHLGGRLRINMLKTVLRQYDEIPPARFRQWLLIQIRENELLIEAKRRRVQEALRRSA